MCWQLFYHGKWTLLAWLPCVPVELGAELPNATLWPNWNEAFELQGWLNGACNNV